MKQIEKLSALPGSVTPAAGQPTRTPFDRTPFDNGESVYELWQSRSEAALQLFGALPATGEELVSHARQHHVSPEKRQNLLEAFRLQWQQLDLPPSSQRSIDKLADPNTQVVITGQQPALAGGAPSSCWQN